jgi:hypothetical protein
LDTQATGQRLEKTQGKSRVGNPETLVTSCVVYPIFPVSLDYPFCICLWVFFTLFPVSCAPNIPSVSVTKVRENPRANQDGQSRDTGNMGCTRHRTKVRENQRANQEWAIQRHLLYMSKHSLFFVISACINVLADSFFHI